ncbi:hypothetical protein [Xenorhabdus bovienii]|nr:hypothetical protein [Xenorhabdus bovienii]MDE9445956.1 hypothetical protein [Xenorhabdus bovienii]
MEFLAEVYGVMVFADLRAPIAMIRTIEEHSGLSHMPDPNPASLAQPVVSS